MTKRANEWKWLKEVLNEEGTNELESKDRLNIQWIMADWQREWINWRENEQIMTKKESINDKENDSMTENECMIN